MSYQIRHKNLGVYQGECMGMGFWHPMSNAPELGICEFRSLDDARTYIDFLCSDECHSAFDARDLSVEIFDKHLSDLLRGSVSYVGPRRTN